MSRTEKLDTHQKALSLNLDTSIFGSFAEIGAGQEVARWFLRAGGASGTVAKTISAYDKEVSDQLYGSATRYVSKQRLIAMLDSEWKQLLGQLSASRGGNTRFFSFVNTFSARNYAGTNDCHGWVGLRFLTKPGEKPNELILHVNLRDSSNLLQQAAVGILGVNLIYAVHHACGSPDEFLASVFDDLVLQRAEIDCLDFSGLAFDAWDVNQIHALLVSGGYAEAVAFPADHRLIPPNELLYQKALVLAPGKFDNVRQLHANLILNSLTQLPKEELAQSKGGLGLYCLSVAGGMTGCTRASLAEIIKHVESLQRLGFGVMLFRAKELYTMCEYANRYTKSRIHFAIGLTVLVSVLGDQYRDLPGALLEGIARLFTRNVRLIVYPMSAEEARTRLQATELTGWTWEEANGLVSVENLHPSGALDSLYRYLLSSGFILSARTGPC